MEEWGTLISRGPRGQTCSSAEAADRTVRQDVSKAVAAILLYPLSSVFCLLSSVFCLLSSVLRPPSSVLRHPSSVIRHPSSVLRHPSSVIRHPSSVIRHPSSVFFSNEPRKKHSALTSRHAREDFHHHTE